MKPTVYIRADGGGTIGMGHLIRCHALADMLRGAFEIVFVIKEAPDSFRGNLQAQAYPLKQIESELEWLEVLRENDIVVLDGYHFDLALQQAIKVKNARLLMIDDLAETPSLADAIINHAPGVIAADYKTLIKNHAILALGADFALLRQDFLLAAQSDHKSLPSKNLFICFGGSDAYDYTGKALQAALKLDFFEKINVVIGPAYVHEKTLYEQYESSTRQVLIHHNISSLEMLAVMQNSGVGIVPASSVLFEALAVGLICLSGAYVDNQQRILQGFLQLGAVFEIKDLNNIENELAAWHQNFNPTLPIVNPIDGKSNFRILELFNRLTS